MPYTRCEQGLERRRSEESSMSSIRRLEVWREDIIEVVRVREGGGGEARLRNLLLGWNGCSCRGWRLGRGRVGGGLRGGCGPFSAFN